MNNAFNYQPCPYGQIYYGLNLTYINGYKEYKWINSSDDFRNAYLNLVFLRKKEAEQANSLIINYLGSNKEKFNFITEEPKDGQSIWFPDFFSPFFASLLQYDSSWEVHKHLFQNHLLYESEAEAINANHNIMQILAKESAKNRFRPLTEVPQNGTKVFMADVTTKEGYKPIIYNSEFERLLNDGLLFSDIYEAMQASKAMKQLINPSL